MPKALDITNQKFGKLTAIKKAPSRSGKTYWLCKCECGNEKEVQTSHLMDGRTKSCGCTNASINKKGQSVISFRKRIKLALVEAFDHKCCYCGIKDDVVIYDFHHLDPQQKLFGIAEASTTHSRQAYADEAKKCVMLCANCHRKIEKNLISLDNVDIITFNEEKYFQTLEELT